MKRSTVSTVAVLTALALSSVALGACQTQPDRDLGDSLDHRSLDLIPPAPTTAFGVSPLEFVGRWQGVAEDPLAFGGVRETYAFPSGSTRFSLEILAPETLEAGSLEGTLVFGSGSPPPPPVDPELGYPSGFAYFELTYFQGRTYEGSLPPFEGYPYQALENDSRSTISFDDERNPLIADGVLVLAFDTAELIGPWCALQQPQPTGTGMSCVKGNSAGSPETTPPPGLCSVGFAYLTPEQEAEIAAMGVSLLTELVDCNKLFLCGNVCECDETTCHAKSTGAELRVRREGDTLTGIFSQTNFLNERRLTVPLGTVRFTRVAE